MKILQFLFFIGFFSNRLYAQNCWQAQPTLQGSSVVCLGKTATLSVTSGSFYEWSTGETTASIQIEPQTHQIYSVTVTSEKGCR